VTGVREIGLISDTHGMLRPSVFEALAGVECILHAGDVGPDSLLDELAVIAPVHAVYGNTDAPGRPRLQESIDLECAGHRIHLSHGHEVGSPTPALLLATYSADIIVYGHTHRQLVTRVDGRLVVNPGAAGARRFDLLPSVARLSLRAGQAEVVVIPLPV
jgi:putative phosphoesterase